MLSIKIANVVPLSNMQLLVFFENGVIKKFDVKPIIKDYPEFEALKEPALFQMVKVEPGGYGVSWNEDLDCSEGEIWENGVEIPLSTKDFVSFAQHEIINTSEVADMLGCTRQNVAAAIKSGYIQPIKTYQRTKLFLRSDVPRGNAGQRFQPCHT